MSKHTPTPWHFSTGIGGAVIYNDVTLAKIPMDAHAWEANAAHIVKCVNSYDELVAALRLSLLCLDAAASGMLNDVKDEIGSTANIVDALLSELEGAK